MNRRAAGYLSVALALFLGAGGITYTVTALPTGQERVRPAEVMPVPGKDLKPAIDSIHSGPGDIPTPTGTLVSEIGTAITSPDSGSADLNDHPYSLNVVYFVPSDRKALPSYRERLTGILLQWQSFVRGELRARGYINSTPGLHFEKDGYLSVSVVEGASPASSYGYTRHAAVRAEVEAYFRAHSSELRSEHYLVLLPTASDVNPRPSLQAPPSPLYAEGRWAFALDFPGMSKDLLDGGPSPVDRAGDWVSSLAVYTTKALNVPFGRVSHAESSQGPNLVGMGLYSYGRSATQLSAAEAAVASSGQLFARSRVADAYASRTFTPTSVRVTASNGTISVSGRFEANGPVTSVIAYIDPDGGELYDRVGWVTTPKSGAFSLKLPLKDLPTTSGPAQVQLRAVFANGYLADLPGIAFKLDGGAADLEYQSP